MDEKTLLEAVKRGEVSVEQALAALKKKPFEDLGYAKVDLHRRVRQGAAEVIYGAGKTPEQIAGIARAMLENGQETILITRLAPDAAARVRETLPLRYFDTARCGVLGHQFFELCAVNS